SSQRRVLPSMSVKRKVTVPLGRSLIAGLFQCVGDSLLHGHGFTLDPRRREGFLAERLPRRAHLALTFVSLVCPERSTEGFAPRRCRSPAARRSLPVPAPRSRQSGEAL